MIINYAYPHYLLEYPVHVVVYTLTVFFYLLICFIKKKEIKTKITIKKALSLLIVPFILSYASDGLSSYFFYASLILFNSFIRDPLWVSFFIGALSYIIVSLLLGFILAYILVQGNDQKQP